MEPVVQVAGVQVHPVGSAEHDEADVVLKVTRTRFPGPCLSRAARQRMRPPITDGDEDPRRRCSVDLIDEVRAGDVGATEVPVEARPNDATRHATAAPDRSIRNPTAATRSSPTPQIANSVPACDTVRRVQPVDPGPSRHRDVPLTDTATSSSSRSRRPRRDCHILACHCRSFRASDAVTVSAHTSDTADLTVSIRAAVPSNRFLHPILVAEQGFASATAFQPIACRWGSTTRWCRR